MSLATLVRSNGARSEILSLDLDITHRGAWTAIVETGDDVAPTGRIEIQIAGEAGELDTFSGTVRPGGAYQGRSGLFVIGGAGTLADPLRGPRDYSKAQGVDVRTILEGIALDAGEQLAPLPQLAGRLVDAWHVGGVTGSQAITLLADRLGVDWRVLDNGTIWLGLDDFLAADAAASFVVHIDRDLGVITCRPSSARLRPGVTVAGERITGVRYTVGEGLRAELLFGERTEQDELRAAVAAAQGPATYARVYAARIAAVRSTGRLDVVADDPAVGPVADVQLLAGVPGARITPAANDRCRIAFDGGSPERRIAIGLEQDRGAVAGVGRVGDGVAVDTIAIANLPSPAVGISITVTPPGGGIPQVFVILGAVSVTGAPHPTTATLRGVIDEGSDEVRLRR